MDKKTIQKNRMKKYFIDAAKEIIKTEGLDNLTTKKIGDLAGYSYATIYNYFENFNELVCTCISDFAEECSEFVRANLKGDSIYERMLSFAGLMIDFNASNPNIYYPFLASSVDFSYFERKNGERFIHPAYTLIVEEIMKAEEFKHYNQKDVLSIADIMTYIFHSKIHFYIHLKTPKDFDTLKSEVLSEVDFIIKHLK